MRVTSTTTPGINPRALGLKPEPEEWVQMTRMHTASNDNTIVKEVSVEEVKPKFMPILKQRTKLTLVKD